MSFIVIKPFLIILFVIVITAVSRDINESGESTENDSPEDDIYSLLHSALTNFTSLMSTRIVTPLSTTSPTPILNSSVVSVIEDDDFDYG